MAMVILFSCPREWNGGGSSSMSDLAHHLAEARAFTESLAKDRLEDANMMSDNSVKEFFETSAPPTLQSNVAQAAKQTLPWFTLHPL